jgi:glutamyl-Q tRNA(Asp) synthetase
LNAPPGPGRPGPAPEGVQVDRRSRIDSAAYRGRFAPSPTGPLHAGSLVAALASWLDARAHGGAWLVRIEDVDTERCIPEMADVILRQLAACELRSDEPVLVQSARFERYATAAARLRAAALAYPCGCTRRDIEGWWLAHGVAHRRGAERVYPGTCRNGLNGKPERALRFRVPAGTVEWADRRLGAQRQDVAAEVGDFVLQRADGPWAYQLAVVVDDDEQRISDVVRGEDLADNTARQLLLQRALGLPTPRYFHTPLVLAADGQKLSKQTGAAPLDTTRPLAALRQAGAVLGLPPIEAPTPTAWLQAAVPAWAGMMRIP